MERRVFLIVLDSFGIGGAPDAAAFGDEGSNTLAAVYSKSNKLNITNLRKLGLYNIQNQLETPKESTPLGSYARMREISNGKDTTIGHWEIAGVESLKPMPTFPDGFPIELIKEFEQRTGRKVLCNRPYSGTDVIRDFGEEHIKTGALIVYTSADSVFQIAANEEVVPVPELYRYCEIARDILKGDWAVGRVIARPFIGKTADSFKRTAHRHDYSLKPPKPTILDAMKNNGLDVISVGKIFDIFSGEGITEQIKTANNAEGMQAALELQQKHFCGLAFINLVDFDMVYGHRNDIDGYAQALTDFDILLGEFMQNMKDRDILMITADHGCDPSTPSTDHSREDVPLIVYGKDIKDDNDLGLQMSFGCIANTIAGIFGLKEIYSGKSLWPHLKNSN